MSRGPPPHSTEARTSPAFTHCADLLDGEVMRENDGTVSYFRKRRGRILAQTIQELSRDLGRDVNILDVGGRRDYWDNVGFNSIGKIKILNTHSSDLGRFTIREDLFTDVIGDACDLKEMADQSIDFYHSNSVIEHVGGWCQMQAMANEARRVARHGWLQTPAWEFPVEPHFKLPFIHWFGRPARTSLLSFAGGYRHQDRSARRLHVERINLLSRGEVRLLFPNCSIITERMILAKSYIVKW